MDDSSDGGDETPVQQGEWVATMALLGKVDREAYRKLRAIAWKHAKPLTDSDEQAHPSPPHPRPSRPDLPRLRRHRRPAPQRPLLLVPGVRRRRDGGEVSRVQRAIEARAANRDRAVITGNESETNRDWWRRRGTRDAAYSRGTLFKRRGQHIVWDGGGEVPDDIDDATLTAQGEAYLEGYDAEAERSYGGEP